jgi:hypothetical protein
MLLVINHYFPRLGAVLSALSSVVFLAIGVETHESWMILMSAFGIALSALQFTVRNRRASSQNRS